MPSPVAFHITWAQLDSLRGLPAPVPKRGYPYTAAGSLIERGLARIDAGQVVPTAAGSQLVAALGGIALPNRPKE